MLQRSGFETPAGVSNDSWFRGVGLLEAGRGQIVGGREGLDCWRQVDPRAVVSMLMHRVTQV